MLKIKHYPFHHRDVSKPSFQEKSWTKRYPLLVCCLSNYQHEDILLRRKAEMSSKQNRCLSFTYNLPSPNFAASYLAEIIPSFRSLASCLVTHESRKECSRFRCCDVALKRGKWSSSWKIAGCFIVELKFVLFVRMPPFARRYSTVEFLLNFLKLSRKFIRLSGIINAMFFDTFFMSSL